jgi:hypothetical protein
MKINDTIVGSIIIGVLIGGSILISQGGIEKRQAHFKMIKGPHLDSSHNEIMINKEIILDSNSNSNFEFFIKTEGQDDLAEDISKKIEKVINEVSSSLPKDLSIKIEVKTKKE